MTSGDSAAVAKAQLSSNQRPFWHASLAKERKDTLKSWLPGIILITAILWIALPIFWGSNLLLLNYFHRLTILSVNFDDGVSNEAVGMQNLLTFPECSRCGTCCDSDTSRNE